MDTRKPIAPKIRKATFHQGRTIFLSTSIGIPIGPKSESTKGSQMKEIDFNCKNFNCSPIKDKLNCKTSFTKEALIFTALFKEQNFLNHEEQIYSNSREDLDELHFEEDLCKINAQTEIFTINQNYSTNFESDFFHETDGRDIQRLSLTNYKRKSMLVNNRPSNPFEKNITNNELYFEDDSEYNNIISKPNSNINKKIANPFKTYGK